MLPFPGTHTVFEERTHSCKSSFSSAILSLSRKRGWSAINISNKKRQGRENQGPKVKSSS